MTLVLLYDPRMIHKIRQIRIVLVKNRFEAKIDYSEIANMKKLDLIDFDWFIGFGLRQKCRQSFLISAIVNQSSILNQ